MTREEILRKLDEHVLNTAYELARKNLRGLVSHEEVGIDLMNTISKVDTVRVKLDRILNMEIQIEVDWDGIKEMSTFIPFLEEV